MTQEQLVSALKCQDPGAVAELVNLYGDRLLPSAFMLCGNETEAQDLVQETFLEAIRSAQRFQQRSSIYTWLYSILLNLSRHYHRKQKRVLLDNDAGAEAAAPTGESVSPLDAGTAASALQAALRTLSDVHREVIVLRYYEGLKIREIARQLGLSPGTVKSRLHYAIGELKQRLPGELNLFGAAGTERMQQP
ncbi:MAG: RNA polymerase sigma factor [Verrucomicrobiae bacterium]|nr:RNA polymerase sigma factor [Verrucomicrobiae bacterium]